MLQAIYLLAFSSNFHAVPKIIDGQCIHFLKKYTIHYMCEYSMWTLCYGGLHNDLDLDLMEGIISTFDSFV